uniref:Uncharacterized protein n=1 Tax=Triticum urartu TaxID=4572 RepID=A0A8R7R4U8_TRIUA
MGLRKPPSCCCSSKQCACRSCWKST